MDLPIRETPAGTNFVIVGASGMIGRSQGDEDDLQAPRRSGLAARRCIASIWPLPLHAVLILAAGCHMAEKIGALCGSKHDDSLPPCGLVEPPAFPIVEAPPAGMDLIPNPLTVSGRDSEFVWNTLVDTVDDYFSVASEQRVRNEGGLLTEGFIETRFLPGASYLEPWLWDSASIDERNLATLQSIRRQAKIRVIPSGGQYQVYVQVNRELEDVNRPALSTPGSTIPRHDATLVRLMDSRERGPLSLGWISLGRDFALEQEILVEYQDRLQAQP